MSKKTKPTRRGSIVPADIGARLKQLRRAYGWRQIQIAKQTGISAPSWNKYELGREVISIYHASRLKKETGAPLDWIYHGQIETLPPRLLERLQNSINGKGNEDDN